ncbi:lytic transglycosylase domain-containing protein [Conchiformibius kuhniae]|uniref:Transglycosylase SLT domain-containing protein n=1 Tax=Conchiformibius kuhniae TaxID=211502 RepID=A0ABD8B7B8_9NEIS|nr:lytic transglycosylase domain-containing protein [Conchiformibius kuhniae]
MMPFRQKALYPLTAAVLTLMAACASQPPKRQDVSSAATAQPQEVKPQAGQKFQFTPRPMQSADTVLGDYARLEGVLAAVRAGDDFAAAQFLAGQGSSAMGESVRNEWLKSLGQRNQADVFKQQYAQLEPEGRSRESRCYAHLFGVEQDAAFVDALVWETKRLPAGCNALLQYRAASGALDTGKAWRRVRGLMAENQISDARALAASLGSPLDGMMGQGAQENRLLGIIGGNASKNAGAAARLAAEAGALSREQAGFAWAVLGLAEARNQNMPVALSYFRNADRSQMTDEQLEWYARAALRRQDWHELASVIESMPAKLRQDSAWLYWLARSRAANGRAADAQTLYRQAAATGRNFYAVLATEELGRRVDVRNNIADTPKAHVQTMAQDGALQRALTLFHTAKQSGNWKMRRQAQAEWRYATRGMNETTMLAAAQLAMDNQFYEMAINTAERTDHLLHYHLRYITPFRDQVTHYAAQAGVDPAWVYGLIRQESRFMIGAQSSVGAQGLMQVMPATAQMIARKIGMSDSELYTIDGNIRMGTWYMADARRSLQNNEVLATAGYNAGPGRARRWQAPHSLEGAVYAETIPFTETRDYVKKVMTNAVYYAALTGQPQTSLKQRMGVVPAR